MTIFNVLTWNIENTGKSKQITRETAGARASYFAEVAVNLMGANVVVFQEPVGQQSLIATIAADIVNAFNLAAGIPFGAVGWTSASTLPAAFGARRTENAWFFWNQAQVQPVQFQGTDSLEILGGSAANFFPTTSGAETSSGRRAFFLVFDVPNSQNRALVTTYHAPFGSDRSLDTEATGLQCLSQMLDPSDPDSIFAIYDLFSFGGSYIFLLCGDYNINIEDYPQLYQQYLMDETHTAPAVVAKTSLKTVASVNGVQPNIDDYLSKGYDNIFYSQGTPIQNNQVVDLITATLNGTLNIIAQGLLSWSDPPVNTTIASTYQSFVFYRENISDHLPVFASFDIQ